MNEEQDFKQNKEITYNYITRHKANVYKRMAVLAIALIERGAEHDNSKLEGEEFKLWCEMDKEPRYPYGTKEYFNKIKRWTKVFETHYKDKRNTHHPENFKDKKDISERKDLLDIIEMVCDWFGFKKELNFEEAIEHVKNQCKRYHFSEELSNLIINTVRNNWEIFA